MDYRKNYIQIYFWQIVSVMLGFAALFVVVPYISSNKIIYGIYSVCTSLTIFFSYADLGFLSSGIKYAAEYYVRGEHKEEVKIVGFTSFIMVSVFAVLALGVIVIGVFPKLLIPELIDGSEQLKIARYLLFILALSCPILIGQRLLNIIYTIRVEDFKFQRMNIVGNIIRILSVLFFFGGGRYMIVPYYIFYQIVNLLIVLYALLYARRHYGYGLRELSKAFRFDRKVYDKVKGLTGASIIILFSSILYNEIDQIVISNVLGIEAVAIYAVAFSVMQLVRSFNGIVFSPYSSRYNHFVGLNDYQGLTRFVKKIIIMFAPILIIPILTLSLSAKPFVVSWVGNLYVDSGFLASFLVLSFAYNFVRDPINQFFVSTERNHILIKYSLLTPIVYWIGVFMIVGHISINAFAVMKFVAPFACIVAYWIIAKKDFDEKGYGFIRLRVLLNTIVPTIIIVVLSSWFFNNWMVEEHTKNALIQNILLIVASALFSLGVSIPFNSELRVEFCFYWSKLWGKIKR